jgi:hypothetical protein
MWEAIGPITSGIGLVAFAMAAITTYLRSRLVSRERQLLATPERDRANVVQALNDAFLVPSLPLDPSRLTTDQQYSLLLEQVRHRAKRFYVLSAFAIALASIVVIVSSSANEKLEAPGVRGNLAPPTALTTTGLLAGPTACDIGVSPGAIRRGASAQLDWSSMNATRVEIAPDLGVVPLAGKVTIWPKVTTTYTITAFSASGDYRRASATVRVGETSQSGAVPTGSLLASPDTISRGGSTELKWNSFDARHLFKVTRVNPSRDSGVTLFVRHERPVLPAA